jgi:Pyruvate/2-oxoacid:ferredoxin oxidoreductase delta subunit
MDRRWHHHGSAAQEVSAVGLWFTPRYVVHAAQVVGSCGLCSIHCSDNRTLLSTEPQFELFILVTVGVSCATVCRYPHIQGVQFHPDSIITQHGNLT